MVQPNTNLMVFWGTTSRQYSLDLLDRELLKWLGISSLFEVEKIEISTHFPPEPYSQTDRANMPSNYLCLGSGSAVFYCTGSQKCYICLVGFYDASINPNHINFWLWGQRKDGENVHNHAIGRGHRISVAEDIQIKILLGKEEKIAVIKQK